MKALIWRTGSSPKNGLLLTVSPKFSLSRRDSFSGANSGDSSPRISLHLHINRHKSTPIRRALSEIDVIRSESEVFCGLKKLSSAGSRSFPKRIPKEDNLFGGDLDDCGSSNSKCSGICPEEGIPLEELGLTGDEFGKGTKSIGGNGSDHGNNGEFNSDDVGRRGDQSKMSDYYTEMLKSNPGDSLLLRNYGKFLQEVEGDTERAEEYYGRAILASPGDGEVLSLYGNLIWDTLRDGERAKAYFDQAVAASPNDCMVMGSYAHFMWEAEEEEEEEINGQAQVSPAMVAVL